MHVHVHVVKVHVHVATSTRNVHVLIFSALHNATLCGGTRRHGAALTCSSRTRSSMPVVRLSPFIAINGAVNHDSGCPAGAHTEGPCGNKRPATPTRPRKNAWMNLFFCARVRAADDALCVKAGANWVGRHTALPSHDIVFRNIEVC